MRPLLVGLHNPLSPHPDDALAAFPPGCSGHRLLRMVQLADSTFSDSEYYTSFDRANLWPGRVFPSGPGTAEACRAAGAEIFARALGRDEVVLFGPRVWVSVAGCVPPPFFESRVLQGTRFWHLSHPSGANRFYTYGDNRRRGGEILLGLARGDLP